MPQKSWDHSQLEALKKLWTERNENGNLLSARQIGEAMGKTKNAIIGAANRAGLPPREKRKIQSVRQARPALRDKAAAVAVRKPWRKTIKLKVITVSQSDGGQANKRRLDFNQLALPDTMPIPFLQIKDGECRSVLDRPGHDGLALFCGAPSVEGLSYCEYHCHIYYSQPFRNRGINGGRITPTTRTLTGSQKPLTQTTECGGGQGNQPEEEAGRRTAAG